MRNGSSRISHDSTSVPNEVPLVSAVICTPAFCSWSRSVWPACGGIAVVYCRRR